jgi:uridylate kinase
MKHPDATLYKQLTYQEALDKELGVMDLTAFCQCRDHDLAIRVFNINKPNILLQIVTSREEGTLVENVK